MKVQLLTTTALVALALSAQVQAAHANVLVSTIDGGYDQDYYDTPSLNISNTTGFDFTNVSIALKGYQPGTHNFGVTQTVALGTIGAGTTDDVIWGIGTSNGFPVPTTFAKAGDLFTYDYDDSYTDQLGLPACAAQGNGYCSYVGNFSVVFTATWNNPAYGPGGTEISSVFSPATNATGGFVGWEGLDPSGLSETTYDDHVGTPNGILANIYVGAPAVPEPATWTVMLVGLGGLGAMLRSGRRKAALSRA